MGNSDPTNTGFFFPTANSPKVAPTWSGGVIGLEDELGPCPKAVRWRAVTVAEPLHSNRGEVVAVLVVVIARAGGAKERLVCMAKRQEALPLLLPGAAAKGVRWQRLGTGERLLAYAHTNLVLAHRGHRLGELLVVVAQALHARHGEGGAAALE